MENVEYFFKTLSLRIVRSKYATNGFVELKSLVYTLWWRLKKTKTKPFPHLQGNWRVLRRWRPLESSRQSGGGGRWRVARVLRPPGEHGLHGANASLSCDPAHHHLVPVCRGILLPEGQSQVEPLNTAVLLEDLKISGRAEASSCSHQERAAYTLNSLVVTCCRFRVND